MNAVCERDGATTRLRCAQCDTGICPACLVRTPIGYKCSRCAGAAVDTRRRTRTGRRVVLGAVLTALLALVSVLRSSGDIAPAPVAVPPPATGAGPARQPVIGEEAQDGQLVFVVDDFACSAKPADAGGKLCSLRFKVRNSSDSPALLLGRFQYLVDSQARTYGADEGLTRAAYEDSSRSFSDLNVNPGVVVALIFVFDVPDAVEPLEAQFRGTGRGRVGVSVRLERRA
jgi:hypothetical protein